MAGNSTHAGRTVVSKVTSVLLAIKGGDGQRLAEIAATSQLPTSTAYRIVAELLDWQVLERHPNGGYRMGVAFRSAGRPAVGHADTPEAVRVLAAPVMEDVFRGTTMPVRVGFLIDEQVAYIEKSTAFRPVSRFTGSARLPVHATALGKVLAAFSPPAAIETILDAPLRRYTRRTVAVPEELRAVLRSVRVNRLAVCNGELDPAWRGVAVPVFGAGGSLVAAIEVRVPSVTAHLGTARAALTIAASSLSRDFAQHGISGSGPVSLADRCVVPPTLPLRSRADIAPARTADRSESA